MLKVPNRKRNNFSQLSGINYLLNMAKNEPEEYKKMYARLPPGAKHFLGDFLQDKLTQQREKKEDPGFEFCELAV